MKNSPGQLDDKGKGHEHRKNAQGDDRLTGDGLCQRGIPVSVDEPHQRDIAQHQHRHGDELLAGREYELLQLTVDKAHIRELCHNGRQCGLEAAVALAGHDAIAPLLPDLVVDGGLQLGERRIHIGVDVLDAGEKPLEHALHRLVEIADIFLHRHLEVLRAQVGRGDHRQCRFQFGGNLLLKATRRQADVPERDEHQPHGEDRHKKGVAEQNGGGSAHDEQEHGHGADHGKPLHAPRCLQCALRLQKLTAEDAGLFAVGHLVDLVPQASGRVQQTVKHAVRELPKGKPKQQKKAGDHTGAGGKPDCDHSESTSLGNKN